MQSCTGTRNIGSGGTGCRSMGREEGSLVGVLVLRQLGAVHFLVRMQLGEAVAKSEHSKVEYQSQ
jgi:hypothetical protein